MPLERANRISDGAHIDLYTIFHVVYLPVTFYRRHRHVTSYFCIC